MKFQNVLITKGLFTNNVVLDVEIFKGKPPMTVDTVCQTSLVINGYPSRKVFTIAIT